MCCTGMTKARCGLLTCSLFLMLLSLVSIAGGIVFVMGKTIYESELSFLKEDLKASATAVGIMSLNMKNLDVTFITLPLGAFLLILGFFLLLISILGIIAASGQFYKYVIVFAALLGCLFFAQIVVIICAYIDRDPFDDTVKKMLKGTLKSYKGDDKTDSLSLGWNSIMSYMKCCGVGGYKDFDVATGWNKMLGGVTLVTPAMCCRTKNNPPSCANAANYLTSTYYNKGCYHHMWDYVTSKTALVLFFVFFVVLVEFLCLFFSVWIVCERQSRGLTKVGSYERYN